MKCEKCGKDYQLSKEDERKRKWITGLVKSRIVGPVIKNIAPGLADSILVSEKYCNTCFHEETDPYAQAIQGIVSKKKEETGQSPA